MLLFSSRYVEPFLLCSKSPRQDTLCDFGYNVTEHRGVYRNQNPVLADTLLLSLNDLSNEPHNIPLKVFASKLQEKRQAFEAIENNALSGMSKELEYTLEGLHELYFGEGENYMANVEALTPDYVKEIGRKKIDHILSVLPTEERVKGLPPQELLKGLNSDDILNGLSGEQLQQLKDKLNKY